MFHLAPPNVANYQQYAKQHFPSLLKPRPTDSHKGTFGTVGVIGGAPSMTGAALLAGSAALLSGCGKVLVGLEQEPLPLPVYPHRPELMLSSSTQAVQHKDVSTWVIGCGLGKTDAAIYALQTVWNSACPQVVLDADAIHLLVEHPKSFPLTKRSDLVLTPHLGEAAHLLNVSISQIQSNRAWAAREIANRYRCWTVLKGHETVISSVRGFLHVNNSGNAGLATAGSGDVLSGIIGSFLAQGITAQEAIPAAVWLHGAAADILAYAQVGPIGLTADEVAQAARWLRNRLVAMTNV